MSAYDETDLVQQIEMVDNLVSEDPASSSGVPSPRLNIFRVGPHEISEGSFVGYFLFSVEQSHLINRWQIW